MARIYPLVARIKAQRAAVVTQIQQVDAVIATQEAHRNALSALLGSLDQLLMAPPDAKPAPLPKRQRRPKPPETLNFAPAVEPLVVPISDDQFGRMVRNVRVAE